MLKKKVKFSAILFFKVARRLKGSNKISSGTYA